MEIKTELKADEPIKLGADTSEGGLFEGSILGEQVSSEEPIEGAGAAPDPEPEGGVETEEEQEEVADGSEETEETEEQPDPVKAKPKPAEKEVKTEAPKFQVDEAEYKKKMDRLKYFEEEIAPLIPQWESFKNDPVAFVKELGIPVQDSKQSYDEEYKKSALAIRSKYGEDFEFRSEDLANPGSDTAMYQKELNDLQYDLKEKYRQTNAKHGDPIKRREQVWVNGEKEIKQTVADTIKEYNVKEEDIVPAFKMIADTVKTGKIDSLPEALAVIDELKIKLAKLIIPLYTKSEKGLRSQAVVKKVEEKIAAEAKGNITPTPTGQKSQIRSGKTNVITFFTEEKEMFKPV